MIFRAKAFSLEPSGKSISGAFGAPVFSISSKPLAQCIASRCFHRPFDEAQHFFAGHANGGRARPPDKEAGRTFSRPAVLNEQRTRPAETPLGFTLERLS